jgi:hypothetical protein
MNRELVNEVNSYYCENFFSNVSNEFNNTINAITLVSNRYNKFISELEEFFNNQLEDGDLDNFKGSTFELSDVDGLINFPFFKKDGKLKFVETDAWRAVIITALAMKELKEKTELQ